MGTDAELVAATRRGDKHAFGVLIDRHRARVVGVARGLVSDRHEAEDVTQEALLQAYLGLDRLRRPERFGSWVAAIAANVARMRLRQLRTRPIPADASAVSAVDGVEQPLELLADLREALAALAPEQRRVVVLHDLEGRTSTEIAAERGETPGAVRVRLHRARAQLRAHLSEHRKETPMIEVTLDDVVVRVLAHGDDEAPTLVNDRLRVVILRERDGDRVLPIWVGPAEGDALALHLGGEATPRPLTADLMARLLDAVGAKVERVAVGSLRDKTFYAAVTVSAGGESTEVDARPSDALNLAARVGAPMFVDAGVFEHGAIAAGERDERMRELEAEWLAATEDDSSPPSRWLSLSPELVKSFWPKP